MKKILTASLVAMMAVTAANADIASTKYVTDQTGASEEGIFTFTNAAANETTLQGAVNAIAGAVASLSGNGTGSVSDQIDSKIDTFKADVIGTVAEGKTVTGMIAEAQTAAEGKVTALEEGQVTTNKDDIAGLKTSKLDVSTYNTDKATFELKANKLDATDSLVAANQTNDKFMSAAGTIAAINQAKDELSSGTAKSISGINTTLNQVKALAEGNEAAIETLGGTVEANKAEAETALNNYKNEAASTFMDSTEVESAITAAVTDSATGALKNYSTTEQMNSAIATAKGEAIADAKTETTTQVNALKNGQVQTNTTNISTITTNLGGLNGVEIPAACESGRCALVMEAGKAKWEIINY